MSEVAKRNKANRRKGAQWQTDFREGMRGEGFDVETLALAGKEDEGDTVVKDPKGFFNPAIILVEQKNAAKFEPSTFVKEAEAEWKNYAKHRGLDPATILPVAVVKRRGHGWRKAYVLTTVEHIFGLVEP
ncbi:hypothetical protein [Micromonospora sp. CB01531]|uniref:hypothetical protein n=1 Tax=Micromonospora sp. CB01531 TaxID=1718947 RepID=UPI000938BE85|nr:hypothetical protein [Micromonospora sp. CB01531]OKI45130.1 hypothetical protein A6A27_12005 [Micromonospora sp. CB01531]